MKYYKTTEKIYDFCKSYIDEHGYAPTIREIGKGVGLSSTSVVHRHMQRLFRNGRFETEHPGEARAFRVISQNSKSTNKSIDKDGLLDYIKEEFPGVIDTHWNWDVLENIIDYTQSHFTFEESLQEEAGYKYRVPHKRVHDLFIKKIESYRDRFELGHSIEAELHEVLSKWLINHIQHDDADYVGAVKENMMGIIKEKEKKKGKNWFARFFS